ncbi:MAG TPA: hypothetical protein VJ914_40275 [Pseudonocardiaceae bacterium]|nr:hypothetical protein [Pseudonocardiaceae bacterium]
MTAPVVSPWMSVAETAAYTRRHPETVRRALREWERSKGRRGLKGAQPNGANACWSVHRDDADAWMSGALPAKSRRVRAIA